MAEFNQEAFARRCRDVGGEYVKKDGARGRTFHDCRVDHTPEHADQKGEGESRGIQWMTNEYGKDEARVHTRGRTSAEIYNPERVKVKRPGYPEKVAAGEVGVPARPKLLVENDDGEHLQLNGEPV